MYTVHVDRCRSVSRHSRAVNVSVAILWLLRFLILSIFYCADIIEYYRDAHVHVSRATATR